MNEPARILLIEDNVGDAVLLREQLSAVPDAPELTTSRSLADGLKLAMAERFALVLLDLSLPDCHGLETVRTAVASLRGVPVLVLTGLEDEQVGRDCVLAGAQSYLVKGRFTADTLIQLIRHALEGRQGR